MAYAPGDFSFISDENEKKILTNMYRAVEAEGVWDFLKAGPSGGSFMFSKEAIERLSGVSKAVEDDGHSGASFACSLREIQFIARHGWDAYVNMYEMKNKKTDELDLLRLETLAHNDSIIKKAIKSGNSKSITDAYEYTYIVTEQMKLYPRDPERWLKAQFSSQYDSEE
jgi:hypothetical protein